MNGITVKDIVTAAGGRLLAGDPDAAVKNISLDSRHMEGADLFIPVIGEKTDGHRYISGAFANGAEASFTSEHDAVPEELSAWCCGENGRALIRVENTVAALQAFGLFLRGRLHMPVVGITGSVGKTSTREMVSCALSGGLKVTATEGNSNGQLGVPVTLGRMDDTADIAVMEMGMSEPGEMSRIAAIAKPDIALMTNIGVSHIENLGSRENIFKEKLHIADGFTENNTLIVNGDDDILGRLEQAAYPFRIVKCGIGPENDVRAEMIVHEHGGSRFTAVFPDKRIPVTLGVHGDHMIVDALLAFAAAEICGVDPAAAAEKLSAYSGYEGRQRIEELGGVSFICDYYNASPDSMKAALKVLSDLDCSGRRIAVLGNMNELGAEAPRFHREVGCFAAACGTDILLTVGEAAKEIAAGAAGAADITGNAASAAGVKEICCFDDTDTCFEKLKEVLRPGDAVLLKASNSLRFGRLRDLWEEYLKTSHV